MSIPLYQMQTAQSGIILNINAGQELTRRMAALGLRPGRQIKIIRKAPWSGPLQVRIGHTEIIIRRGEAEKIEVEPTL